MRADARLRWVLLVTSAATFVASLDLFVVNVAFNDLQRAFGHTDAATLSWVLNVYTIALAALPIPFGRFADAYGRLRGFVAGMVLFAVASALCAAAPSLTWLIVARGLQGVGAAALLPTSLSLLLGEFPPARRAGAVATWAATGSVAAAFGTPVGALLTRVSWRWIFLINVPIIVVTLLVARRVLRESRADGPVERPDLVGTVLLTAGVSLVTLGLVQADSWGWATAGTIGTLVGGLAAVALFLRQCTRHRAPVIELDLFRERSFSAASGVTLLLFAGFGAFLLSNVLLMTDLWRQGVLTAGLQFAPGGLVAAVVSMFAAARLAARFGYRPVAAVGCLLLAVSNLTFRVLVGVTPGYARDFLPALMIGGFGVGLAIPVLAAAISATLPPARRATGSAVFAMSRQLGTVLGVAATVALSVGGAEGHALFAYQRAWVFIAIVEAVAALSCLLLPTRRTAAVVPAARVSSASSGEGPAAVEAVSQVG
ncbi:conserved membrane hypothetical protein [Frankia canadensis]|uniref:Major facilitator superfamily (MFS) profile domain-containing protein n=1 Tax=Frankia canadensis TaxID=1836972 RepID=A0A2I2KRW8_9ACTN|nr:MFS transporter [Frankia canadensis]SNQ48413.1 conserved membrane hypothetical protein [Frankia canadensis]SOU55703.1 conserved membrane hypothetical protein [Frankia canadensis]